MPWRNGLRLHSWDATDRMFCLIWSVPCLLMLWLLNSLRHKCVGKLIIIGSDNGLSPGRRQGIIWTNAEILSIEPLETKFSESFIKIVMSNKKLYEGNKISNVKLPLSNFKIPKFLHLFHLFLAWCLVNFNFGLGNMNSVVWWPGQDVHWATRLVQGFVKACAWVPVLLLLVPSLSVLRLIQSVQRLTIWS